MKKALSLVLLYFFTIALFSQEKKPQLASNELRINMFYTTLGLPEIAYEKYLNNESSIGVSVAFSVDSNIDLNYLIIPNYRHYFGKKRAAGFFLEANAALFSEKTYFPYANETGLGLGMALGGKFVTKQNWTANLTLGLGRNFINNSYTNQAYPRMEISIGKRF